jgi:hypothetical protein
MCCVVAAGFRRLSCFLLFSVGFGSDRSSSLVTWVFFVWWSVSYSWSVSSLLDSGLFVLGSEAMGLLLLVVCWVPIWCLIEI